MLLVRFRCCTFLPCPRVCLLAVALVLYILLKRDRSLLIPRSVAGIMLMRLFLVLRRRDGCVFIVGIYARVWLFVPVPFLLAFCFFLCWLTPPKLPNMIACLFEEGGFLLFLTAHTIMLLLSVRVLLANQ